MTSQTKKMINTHIKTPLIFSSLMVLSVQALAAPTAVPDSYTTTVDRPITISPKDNDQGNGLFIEAVDQPAPYGTGSVTFNRDVINYTPPAGFSGETEFWYGIKDANGDITSAPITITVEAASP